jgi:membrane fusion protein, multidrug efflux system
MAMPQWGWWGPLSAAFLGLAPTVGCASKGAADREPPLPVVIVVKAQRVNVPIVVSTNGVTRSLNEVTIRARVKGFLKERHFEEGSNVKAGQLLLVIDEAPFKVALDQARASLAKAQADYQKAQQSKAPEMARAQLRLDEAQLQLTQLDERRQAEFYAKKTVPKAEYDQAEANRKKAAAQVESDKAHLDQSVADHTTNILAAKAAVEAAEADVRNAEIELGYCRMEAPITGRIGETHVKVGNLVGGDSSTELATIEQLEPMGVDLRPSARNLAEINALVNKGLLFDLSVQGDRPHPHQAKAVFVDNRIDPGTSTVLIKSTVPNPDESLLPGEYVQAQATIGEHQGAVVVPERAVMEGQAGSTVYIVDDKGRIAVASVRAAESYQGLRVIESGLEAGQLVVVEGFQLVRPGMAVKAEETPLVLPKGLQVAVLPAIGPARGEVSAVHDGSDHG